jgi:hypothetical protein
MSSDTPLYKISIISLSLYVWIDVLKKKEVIVLVEEDPYPDIEFSVEDE